MKPIELVKKMHVLNSCIVQYVLYAHVVTHSILCFYFTFLEQNMRVYMLLVISHPSDIRYLLHAHTNTFILNDHASCTETTETIKKLKRCTCVCAFGYFFFALAVKKRRRRRRKNNEKEKVDKQSHYDNRITENEVFK